MRQAHVVALDLGAGIDVNDAGVAVEHELIALDDRFHQMLDADDGRDFERARKDRRMRRDAARLQRDPGEPVVIDHRQLRERQLLGDDNRRLAEGRALFLLPQMTQHAMADVAEIGRALAQVVVGNREHRGAQLLDHAKQRALGGVAVGNRVADAADELFVFENHAMAVEDFEVRLGHQRFHPNPQRRQLGERTGESLLEALALDLGVARLLMPIDAAQKSADDVRVALRKSGRRGKSRQPRSSNLGRRGVTRLAADLLVILELAVGLDHPALVLEPLFFLGDERFAQPEMRKNLRDLVGRGAQQADFVLVEFAPLEGLRDQHSERLLAAVMHRHAEKSMEALLAGLGKILVALMTDRVGHVDWIVFFQHQPDQSLVETHRNLADRFAIEPDGGAQHEPLALRIEEVERTDLGLHPARDRERDAIERLAEVVGMLAANRREMLDQSEAILVSTHL